MQGQLKLDNEARDDQSDAESERLVRLTLDPEWVIATSTVVLVMVTAFYAWRTSNIANGTREMAEATRQSVDVATTMLVLQHAPIVIPRPAGGGGSTAPDGKWTIGVGLQNIGSAPAFAVSVRLRVGAQDFDAGPVDTLEAKQEPHKVNFGITYGDFATAGKVWSAEVKYSDLLNRSYAVMRSGSGELEITLEGQALRLPTSLQETREM